MSKNPCYALREAGTAIWLDQLSRSLIVEGRLESLIGEAALSGLTSNPTIFHKAMTSGPAYDAQIEELSGSKLGTEDLYEHLAIRDIQMACDILRPVWEDTKGADGFVSLEVSPHLARDTQGTINAARRLSGWVDRPNVLIKVPGTVEGTPAIEELLAEGTGINITLLFAVEAYEQVAEAYVRALERRAASGQSLDIPSVASFFVSRIDTLVDSMLEDIAKKSESGAAGGDAEKKVAEILALRGKAAVANAKIAYRSFQRIFGTPQFQKLRERGARVQRPLWASTSTKNPAYQDVMYVEPLIGPDTVNTMPMETIMAFLDHGRVAPASVMHQVEEADRHLARLEELGISFCVVTDKLLEDGIAKFNDPYDKLLKALEAKRKS